MTDELTRPSAPARRSGEFKRLLAAFGGNGYWIAAEASFLCGWTLVWACRLGLLAPAAIALGLGLVAVSLIAVPFIPILMAKQARETPLPGGAALPEQEKT